jgi:ADP-ribose pyrophosphatase
MAAITGCREGVTLNSKQQQSFQGRIIRVDMHQITLPNGHRMEMEVVHHPGGAAVVALDEKHRVCLLKQYRCVFDQWLWELPAGKRDGQEPPLETAQRELQEEAGVVANHWRELGPMISSPGVFTEQVYLYLAQQCVPTETQVGDDEVFEVHWVPLDDAYQQVLSGEIVDAKSVIGILKTKALLE